MTDKPEPPLLDAGHALFLDFDGVLVDIVPTPDAVVVRDGLIDSLEAVRARFGGALALVSGRALDDLSRHMAPFSGPAAGSHGAERRRGDGQVVVPGSKLEAEAFAIATRLDQAVKDIEGLMVERKTYSVALHYRAAPERAEEAVAEAKRIAAGYLGWQVMPGKMVVEIKPNGLSKGRAVTEFMREPPFAGRVPVFIGDDVTDEDGMRAAAVLGGFGIRVGEGVSVARYRLADPNAVFAYLRALAQGAD